MKVNELNALATQLVGDCKTPNVFFVTLKGDTILVAVDFAQAYGYWRSLANTRKECMLEDRMTGVICEAGPVYDDNDKPKPGTFQRRDDARHFGFREGE